MRSGLPTLAGAGLLLLFTAGCHKPEEPAATETNLTEPAKPAPPPVQQPKPVEPPKPEAPKAEAPKVQAPPETPPDQQVLDDAVATGMTARVDRGGDDADTAPGNGSDVR